MKKRVVSSVLLGMIVVSLGVVFAQSDLCSFTSISEAVSWMEGHATEVPYVLRCPDVQRVRSSFAVTNNQDSEMTVTAEGYGFDSLAWGSSGDASITLGPGETKSLMFVTGTDASRAASGAAARLLYSYQKPTESNEGSSSDGALARTVSTRMRSEINARIDAEITHVRRAVLDAARTAGVSEAVASAPLDSAISRLRTLIDEALSRAENDLSSVSSVQEVAVSTRQVRTSIDSEVDTGLAEMRSAALGAGVPSNVVSTTLSDAERNIDSLLDDEISRATRDLERAVSQVSSITGFQIQDISSDLEKVSQVLTLDISAGAYNEVLAPEAYVGVASDAMSDVTRSLTAEIEKSVDLVRQSALRAGVPSSILESELGKATSNLKGSFERDIAQARTDLLGASDSSDVSRIAAALKTSLDDTIDEQTSDIRVALSQYVSLENVIDQANSRLKTAVNTLLSQATASLGPLVERTSSSLASVRSAGTQEICSGTSCIKDITQPDVIGDPDRFDAFIAGGVSRLGDVDDAQIVALIEEEAARQNDKSGVPRSQNVQEGTRCIDGKQYECSVPNYGTCGPREIGWDVCKCTYDNSILPENHEDYCDGSEGYDLEKLFKKSPPTNALLVEGLLCEGTGRTCTDSNEGEVGSGIKKVPSLIEVLTGTSSSSEKPVIPSLIDLFTPTVTAPECGFVSRVDGFVHTNEEEVFETGSSPFPTGDYYSSVIDESNAYAYFLGRQQPGSNTVIVKVDLDDFAVVDHNVVGPYSFTDTLMLDTKTNALYYMTSDEFLIRIDLTTLEPVGQLDVGGASRGSVGGASVIDVNKRSLYLFTSGFESTTRKEFAEVVRVNLDSFTETARMPLRVTTQVRDADIDAQNGIVYVTFGSSIEKFDLNTMETLASFEGYSFLGSGVLDLPNGHGYFLQYEDSSWRPSVVQLDLVSFTARHRMTLAQGSDPFQRSAVALDERDGFVYFVMHAEGGGSLVSMFDISGDIPVLVDTFSWEVVDEEYPTTAVFDSTRGALYLGASNGNDALTRLRVSPEPMCTTP